MVSLAVGLWTCCLLSGSAQGQTLAQGAVQGEGPAADAVQALDVLLNGRDTGEVIDFTAGPDGLSVEAADLSRLGFILPANPARVSLARIRGLSWSVDERRQTINLNAGRGLVRAQAIDLGSDAGSVTAQVSPGALVNYDIVATDSQGHVGLTGEAEVRAFGRWGVLDSTALISSDAGHALRRLDTAWSLADPVRMTRYAVGDLVSGGLAWTRPVRMAGVQISSDFLMRPDLVTFPTPTLKGDVAAASTVDVFVNGEQRYSGAVAGGAFDLASVPVLTGVNQISMVVTDATGRRTVQNLPFYASPVLLAPGLASFSLESGLLRQGYGGLDDSYARGAASVSGRYGLSPAWTLEGHAETSAGLAQAGVGSSFALRYGILSVAAAASADGSHRGGYYDLSFQRVDSRFSVSAGIEGVVGDYRDLASLGIDAFPRFRGRLQVSVPLDSVSGLSTAYVHTVASPGNAVSGGDALAASYSRELGRGLSMSASLYANRGDSQGEQLFLTLTAVLGGRSAGISAISTPSGPVMLAQIAKSSAGLGDSDWSLAAQSGRQSQLLAQIGQRTSVGQFTLGVDHLGGSTAVQASASGSLVLMDYRLFPSRAIDRSFAVVDSGAPGVTVLSDNRVVGRSDSAGRLLAPDLRPFQGNIISLNATDVPFDITLDKAVMTVNPLDRVGVIVRFPTRRDAQALLMLVDKAGRPLPVGGRVVDASPQGAVIGYDGEALAVGLKPHNALAVRADDGRLCIARFDYKPTAGGIGRIGPIACIPEPVL